MQCIYFSFIKPNDFEKVSSQLIWIVLIQPSIVILSFRHNFDSYWCSFAISFVNYVCLNHNKMKLTTDKRRIMGPHWNLLFYSCILFMCFVNAQATDIDRICPRMLHKVFNGYAPNGNHFIHYNLSFVIWWKFRFVSPL